MDRNPAVWIETNKCIPSLSARRAWIEIGILPHHARKIVVALRKESVDRNTSACPKKIGRLVALRKESVDRNKSGLHPLMASLVALRKESVDRNDKNLPKQSNHHKSLSARRAWIEIEKSTPEEAKRWSLSARRAWIEICCLGRSVRLLAVALRKESVDRNIHQSLNLPSRPSRSPQGERG